MAVAIITKIFEDQIKPGFRPPFYNPNLNKFLLKAFNKLSHDHEVSRALVAGFLLGLPNYYIAMLLLNQLIFLC